MAGRPGPSGALGPRRNLGGAASLGGGRRAVPCPPGPAAPTTGIFRCERHRRGAAAAIAATTHFPPPLSDPIAAVHAEPTENANHTQRNRPAAPTAA